MVETRSTKTVQDPGHMHSANSCAVPCSAGNPGMYQQSSFLVITLFSSEYERLTSSFVAVMPQYGALINNLIVTTDRFIMGSRTASNPSSRSSSQGTKPRIAPAPLAWSVALRASRGITIQASIEYVVCLPTLSSFIYLVLGSGRRSEYIDHTGKPIQQFFSLRILV